MEHQPSPGGRGVDALPQRPDPTPRSSSPVTTSIRCRNDRPSRSSRHTTRVSPGRSCSSTSSSCGLRSNAPDAWSVHTFQHPAVVSSSTCRSGFCSSVDTRVVAQQVPHARTVPQTPFTTCSWYVGSGHQLRAPEPRSTLMSRPIRSIDRASPDRPTIERLRGGPFLDARVRSYARSGLRRRAVGAPAQVAMSG